MAESEVQVRIIAVPDGPLRVEGACEVLDPAGKPYPPRQGKAGIVLCRCGASGVKPWCDGTHRRVGFRTAEPAPGAVSG